jgi:glycosyltransferase involved in cell wall biosynthesis
MHAAGEVLRKDYDIVHLQLARMMPYAAEWKHVPLVVDFVDTLSLNMRRRLDREKLILKPLLFYEWFKMKHYEASLDSHFDGAIISSPVDQHALPYCDSVEVVPNGVDIDYFRYFSTSQREPGTIIFTGNMGYFPNVDAVTYFCRQIFPQIKRNLPTVKFRIVGYSPKSVVSRLSAFNKSIEVTGFVDNIANELGKASVAVAPMQSGSGVQNKILEAMATGTPVVATRLATRAIGSVPGRDILIADRPDEFAAAVERLLRDRSLCHSLGLHGRKLVEQKYSWASVVKELEDFYRTIIGRPLVE